MTMTQPLGDATDDEIISASLADPERFGAIFDRHVASVLAYVRRRVGPDAAAEIVSETFTRGFEHRARFAAGGDGARPWLLGIATNLIGDHRRAEVRQLRRFAKGETAGVDAVERVGERLDAQAAARTAAAAIRGLPRRQRDVLLLHAWCDLSPDEIATALGEPAGTIRSLLSRARAGVVAAVGDVRNDGREVMA
jgi:RNA polymerase sigma factor (sigma-70 family)